MVFFAFCFSYDSCLSRSAVVGVTSGLRLKEMSVTLISYDRMLLFRWRILFSFLFYYFFLQDSATTAKSSIVRRKVFDGFQPKH